MSCGARHADLSAEPPSAEQLTATAAAACAAVTAAASTPPRARALPALPALRHIPAAATYPAASTALMFAAQAQAEQAPQSSTAAAQQQPPRHASEAQSRRLPQASPGGRRAHAPENCEHARQPERAAPALQQKPPRQAKALPLKLPLPPQSASTAHAEPTAARAATMGAHVPAVPVQYRAPTVVEAYPAAQVQRCGGSAQPPHHEPAGHSVQEPVVPAQDAAPVLLE